MLCLAVDTTADHGSIALADESGVLADVRLHAPRGFSHVLFGETEALLKRQGVSLPEIGLYAGAAGPGSFTGVRVGLAAVKGLAHVTGKPAAAVSNLEALAALGSAPLRAPLIDAKRGEVFAALYDNQGRIVLPEMVGTLARFLELAGTRNFEWITAEPEALGAMAPAFPVVAAPAALSGVIAQIALQRFSRGETTSPAALEANYVRRSDAEILFRES